MENFEYIVTHCLGGSKTSLHWLYNTSSWTDPEKEVPRTFYFHNYTFWFTGTGFRNTEKLIMHIGIPDEVLDHAPEKSYPEKVASENFILHIMYPRITELLEEIVNDKKDVREKANFSIQTPDTCMDRKSGCVYDHEKRYFEVRINLSAPLKNAVSLNTKKFCRAVLGLLRCFYETTSNLDKEELAFWKKTCMNQRDMRRFMQEKGLCAFVADGSILPRQNGTEEPMKDALPFESPETLRVSIQTSSGDVITGMGIKKGITVITGGGYSGKTTILDAIEQGIYDHIPGDGREYVLADPTTLKTNAEDGRPVENVDLSPFFRWLKSDSPLKNFSTLHASGSVSQASNIVEAVCGNVKLLLIDEDKSATNFMMRDETMRKIVPDEPIIPFTDRICELKNRCDTSVILVIGGSGEYLAYSDTVILMKDFKPFDISDSVRKFGVKRKSEQEEADWMNSRRIVPKTTSQPFLYFRSVVTENEKKIILDDYSADVTCLTALTTGDRMNTAMKVMEKLLTDKEGDDDELLNKLAVYTDQVLGNSEHATGFNVSGSTQLFYAQIRPIDAWCCLNRSRGVHMKRGLI
ncbi:MAG: ABC-ATPase domain-containing protein [Lachnospiraceae bacterium]|nr:ABC-ATPase domain-containing protein [Lachnospiraceae bacterium]